MHCDRQFPLVVKYRQNRLVMIVLLCQSALALKEEVGLDALKEFWENIIQD